MISATLLVAVMAALLPPAWIALSGGADVDVLGQRVALYRATGPVLALAGCLALALLAPPGRRRGAVGRGLALAAFALVAAVVWTGGFENDWISVHRTSRPAIVGWVFVLAAALRARSFAPGRALPPAAAGLAAGGLLTGAVLWADRADLERRLAARPPAADAPDVVFLLLDTLRADALGAYGARPSPSPFLDGLAGRSVQFERAFAQASWTVPSVSSLMSSFHPSTYFPREGREKTADGRYIRLPGGLPWLPERLREAGYHTAGFQKNPLLQAGTRFGRGFDVYEYVRGDTAEHRSAAQLVDAVLRWGDVMADHRAAGGDGSFFLYAHFMDPHIEYRPPAEFLPAEAASYQGTVDGGVKSVRKVEKQPGGPTEADLAHIRARYRAEVAYLDHELARLRDGLAERGLWDDDTVVVLVADHGEQFFEHGEFMHGTVFRENLHVPFLFKGPGLAARRVDDVVRLLDVTPTLLDFLGLAPLAQAEGRSLVPLLRGQAMEPVVALSEGTRGGGRIRATGPRYSLVRLPEGERLYDLRTDPAETRDLAAEAPEALAELRAVVDRYEARSIPFAPPVASDAEMDADAEVDADTRKRLEALGYIE